MKIIITISDPLMSKNAVLLNGQSYFFIVCNKKILLMLLGAMAYKVETTTTPTQEGEETIKKITKIDFETYVSK